MKTKRYSALLLALVMLVSLAVCGSGTASAEDAPVSAAQQLKLISNQMNSLIQTNTELPWYYCVADLDHNGCLEIIAASQHPTDRSTNVRVWTVSRDGTSLGECRLDKDEEESFPDIMTDTVDTYHVKDTDTWYYTIYDNVVISDSEVYTVKTAIDLKNGILGYDALAVEHTVVTNGVKNVSHTDMKGINISPDQYNDAGANAFAAAERSNTAFEWLTADKASDLNRLTESYEVFLGTREPTEVFPVPKPVALGGTGTAATPTPSPVVTPVPTPQPQPVQPTYLMITKNPTNENRKVGGNAIFVACANAYDSLNWTFVSPDGGEYSPAGFVAGTSAYVSGEYSTTITVSNLESWMNGWGAYCSFYFQGQTARTSTAYIYISSDPQPTPPTPTPTYGSMSGTAYSGGGGYAINLQNGTQVFVDSWNCNIEGQFYDGCSAIVYYVDYPSTANVYRADIWGNQGLLPDPDPQPEYGSMSGNAYSGGGGYAIDLANGSQVYVDAWKCNVEGQFYEGASAMVYYTGYPSSDSIYSVDIWGNQGLIIDDDQGGWAGSNYYDDEDMGGWAGSSTIECWNCHADVPAAYENCPYCGATLW